MQITVSQKMKGDAPAVVFVGENKISSPDLPLAEIHQAVSEFSDANAGGYQQLQRGNKRVHLYVLPRKKEITPLLFKEIMQTIASVLAAVKETSLNIFPENLNVCGWDEEQTCEQLVQFFGDMSYQFNAFKSKPRKSLPEKIHLVTQGLDGSAMTSRFQALINGVNLAKDLGNAPGNICTPDYLAAQAKQLQKRYPKLIKVQCLGEKELEKLGMNAYLAVAQGSANKPQFILMEYTGSKKKSAPVVLLGKGVTFDTGGISLKPSGAMDEMKYDMSGASSVFGVMQTFCELKAPLNLVGAVAAAENMPSSCAYRPGDIIKTMSGKTVEVLNTDAEGRMVLCDALTYLERYKPAAVVDMATLTGACVVALGHLRSGLFSNDKALAKELESAADQSHDLIWRLPLDKEYMQSMKSNFADIANVGGRDAGTITAAGFLAEFTEKYPWAHLDIAGTAWRSGKRKGASGRPVPLLIRFLLNRITP